MSKKKWRITDIFEPPEAELKDFFQSSMQI